MRKTEAVMLHIPKLIRQMQLEIQWKPESAARHLLKRKLRGHLPANATLDDYEHIIKTTLTTREAVVYLYWYKGVAYPSVANDFDEKKWLVMFSMDGVMESAFVVENPRVYLSPPQFERIGFLSEVLDESE